MKKYNQLKADIILDFFLDEICKFRGFKKSDVLKRNRKREFSDARAIVARLAKNQCPEISLNEIATFFNYREHSTIFHSLKKIETLKSSDKTIKATLEHFEKLQFVEDILSSHNLTKVDTCIYSKRINGNLFDVYLQSNINCGINYYDHFYINNIDIFDAIILLQNIDNNPLGTLINSLKN